MSRKRIQWRQKKKELQSKVFEIMINTFPERYMHDNSMLIALMVTILESKYYNGTLYFSFDSARQIMNGDHTKTKQFATDLGEI
jgi:hypothetical protein